jgi:hypothetical protein
MLSTAVPVCSRLADVAAPFGGLWMEQTDVSGLDQKILSGIGGRFSMESSVCFPNFLFSENQSI